MPNGRNATVEARLDWLLETLDDPTLISKSPQDSFAQLLVTLIRIVSCHL